MKYLYNLKDKLQGADIPVDAIVYLLNLFLELDLPFSDKGKLQTILHEHGYLDKLNITVKGYELVAVLFPDIYETQMDSDKQDKFEEFSKMYPSKSERYHLKPYKEKARCAALYAQALDKVSHESLLDALREAIVNNKTAHGNLDYFPKMLTFLENEVYYDYLNEE
jgi:hypothetical protein